MTSIVKFLSQLKPRARQGIIMFLDVVMVLLAIPISLLLSMSRLSFEPFSLTGLAIWAFVAVASHLLFRFAGFYNTVWRFASTPDFFNIISTCGVLSLGLYLISVGARYVEPFTGINERQFIVFFLVAFTIVSVPRLIYRYLREGAGWRLVQRLAEKRPHKRALFVGTMADADVIIRFTQADSGGDTQVIGIMSTEDDAEVGTRLRGVPIVASLPRLSDVLDDYATGTERIDLLILGRGVENGLEEFAELVRVARRRDIRVVQFSGLSQIERGGMPVLETVDMETILRRATVATDTASIERFISGRRILVTGGAGSIGRTMVKRCLQLGAEEVLVADLSEFGIFKLLDSMDGEDAERLTTRIVDVGDKEQFTRIVRAFGPDIIFHAAALKHVPLLEENWVSAIKTNVFGSLVCAEVAAQCGVGQFVLISSDKAADPRSILGLTKRVAEEVVNAFHFPGKSDGTMFIAVRFGNVFGSDGSVATIFEKQIRAGGPVTITDPSMTRYMMTIGEAVDLVITAAADAQTHPDRHDCGIYMLDMGEPVAIQAVAETMIRLAGLKPQTDIPIVYTGVRPGEKLHESLVAKGERIVSIDVPSVFGVKTGILRREEIYDALDDLRDAVHGDDKAAAVEIMKNLYRALPEDEHTIGIAV